LRASSPDDIANYFDSIAKYLASSRCISGESEEFREIIIARIISEGKISLDPFIAYWNADLNALLPATDIEQIKKLELIVYPKDAAAARFFGLWMRVLRIHYPEKLPPEFEMIFLIQLIQNQMTLGIEKHT